MPQDYDDRDDVPVFRNSPTQAMIKGWGEVHVMRVYELHQSTLNMFADNGFRIGTQLQLLGITQEIESTLGEYNGVMVESASVYHVLLKQIPVAFFADIDRTAQPAEITQWIFARCSLADDEIPAQMILRVLHYAQRGKLTKSMLENAQSFAELEELASAE